MVRECVKQEVMVLSPIQSIYVASPVYVGVHIKINFLQSSLSESHDLYELQYDLDF